MVIILVVVNVSSLVTIGYHRYQYKQKRTAEMRDGRSKDDHIKHSRREMKKFSERYQESLNLSALQRQQMDSIQTHYEQQRQEASREMGQLRKALGQALAEPEVGQQVVHELSQQQAILFSQINENTIALNLAIRSILEPGQISAYIDQLKNMERRREERSRSTERSRRN